MTVAYALPFAAVAALLAAGAPPAPDPAIARGHDLAQSRCAECHAIEATGASPDRAAPPFRTLGRNYPVANLEESFAEGAYVGHAEMPNFVLEGGDVADLIAYLQSLNGKPSKSRRPRN